GHHCSGLPPPRSKVPRCIPGSGPHPIWNSGARNGGLFDSRCDLSLRSRQCGPAGPSPGPRHVVRLGRSPAREENGMRRVRRGMAVLVLAAGMGSGVAAEAGQEIGTLRWQLAPFCNVLALAAAVEGSGIVLSGFDDNCGVAHSAAYGTASLNPNGTLNLGLTIVTGGGPGEHLDALLDPATASGPGPAARGPGGTFVFNPASAAGPPRPAPSAIQARVTGTCGGAGAIRAVNADGSVSCTAVFGTNTNIAAAGDGAECTT